MDRHNTSTKTHSYLTVLNKLDYIDLSFFQLFQLDYSLVLQSKTAIMDLSKTLPVSNTVVFSSIFVSVAICFVALIHVEVELHAHRQMLRVLTQQRDENIEPRNTAHDEAIDSGLNDMLLHGNPDKGRY